MKIILTNEESELFFFNALCNGLTYIYAYGLEVSYSQKDYSDAKNLLQDREPNNSICFEDVLMQILKSGHSISLIDTEGDENEAFVYLKDVHDKVKNTPTEHLLAMQNENDDACTADVILQTVFLDEIIYG